MGNYNLPNLIKSFQNSFPGIKMHIVEEQCDTLLAMLLSSRIDVAFVQSKKANPQLIAHPLIQDIMVAVVSSNHPLADRVSVDISELKNEKFILTPPSSGHYQDFHAACLMAGFEPQIILSCAIVKTMLSFVREDIGITVLSSKVAMAEQDSGISILGLTPTIHRTISMVTRNSDDTTPAVKMFSKFTIQWLETQRSIERAGFSALNYPNTRDARLIPSRNMKELNKGSA
jgi:DNA-binding transcriptional LysR family regulator